MRAEGGQAIVLIAIVMAALTMGVGLAADTGELYVARRGAQTAADSAAWAGAVVLLSGGTQAAAASAAAADATRNGYTAGSGTTVTIAAPPVSGTYAGDRSFVEVTIVKQVTTRFFPGPRPVTARAVAGATRSGTGYAILVTHANTADALTVGSGTLTVTGSGIQVNSTSTSAINIGSGSIGSPYTNVRGGVAAGDTGKISPAATTGAPVVPDPFLTLPGPDTTGMVTRSNVPLQLPNGSVVTLEPGIYYGGIQINGNTSIVTLNPGIYVLRGGPGAVDYGFTVNNSAQVRMAGPTGGVLLFNTYSNYPGAPGGSPDCGAVDLNSGGQITLRPQTVGTYAGATIYQDRACTTTMQFRGGGNWTLNGTVYLPSATFSLGGTSGVAQNIQVVAQRVAITGAASITMAYTNTNVAGGRVPALVE